MKTALVVVAVLALAAAAAFKLVLRPRNAVKAEEANRIYIGALRQVLAKELFDKGPALTDISSIFSDPDVAGVAGFWLSPGMAHPRSRQVAYYAALDSKDTGGLGYVNNPKDKDFGKIFIDCTHVDARGKVWNSY